MNNLEQQQLPPDEDNPNIPHEFKPSKVFSYAILSYTAHNLEDEEVALSTVFNAFSQPILHILINEEKILYNPAFEELCGRTRAEDMSIDQFVGRFWETENMSAIINDLLASDTGYEVKKIYRSTRLERSYRANFWVYACLTKSNRQRAWIVFEKVFDDAEKASREKKLDSSAQTIEIFFSNLSHEIRTPLNAILGFAELLSIKDLAEDQRMHYLDIIRNKGRLLLHYLEDVVELTKLENQTIQFSITETNLPQLFNEIHREYLNEMHQKALLPELFLKIPPNNEVNTCYTDKGRLYQLMKHLLDVALILTEKGYIQLGYELKDARQISYFVRYTGKNLSGEQQKILADPLRIRENIADPLIQKIGLKLALVRLIARCLEGKFSLEMKDQLDAFVVTLPYKRKEPPTDTVNKPIEHKPNWKIG